MADPANVSPEAKATRRRALGRRLIKNGSDIGIIAEVVKRSEDTQFLTAAETKALEKQLKYLDTVKDNLYKLGGILEGKK